MTPGQIDSFNAGYHRGRHTEYHGEDVHELFVEWTEGGYRDDPDPEAFTEGYWEGYHEYEREQIERERGQG
jgi:hypothetical protein